MLNFSTSPNLFFTKIIKMYENVLYWLYLREQKKGSSVNIIVPKKKLQYTKNTICQEMVHFCHLRKLYTTDW